MTPAKPSPSSRKPEPARILVVDDHPIVREGFIGLINRCPDLKVTAEAEDIPGTLRALEQGTFDLIVLDLLLKGGDGLELIKQIKVRYPVLPILVVTMQDEVVYAERCMRAGASGYIMKNEVTDHIISAIARLREGGIFLSQKMNDRILRKVIAQGGEDAFAQIELLSDRELHVFQMIGSGLVARQIAETLGLSVKTIESHRENIKNKLKLQNAAELTACAVSWSQGRSQADRA